MYDPGRFLLSNHKIGKSRCCVIFLIKFYYLRFIYAVLLFCSDYIWWLHLFYHFAKLVFFFFEMYFGQLEYGYLHYVHGS